MYDTEKFETLLESRFGATLTMDSYAEKLPKVIYINNHRKNINKHRKPKQKPNINEHSHKQTQYKHKQTYQLERFSLLEQQPH